MYPFTAGFFSFALFNFSKSLKPAAYQCLILMKSVWLKEFGKKVIFPNYENEKLEI